MVSTVPPGKSFSELLHWHLINGTRPAGEVQREWTNPDFAVSVKQGLNEKSVRNWRRGAVLPRLIDHIERALFGDAPMGERAAWRDELRAAYSEALNNGKEPTTLLPASLIQSAADSDARRLQRHIRLVELKNKLSPLAEIYDRNATDISISISGKTKNIDEFSTLVKKYGDSALDIVNVYEEYKYSFPKEIREIIDEKFRGAAENAGDPSTLQMIADAVEFVVGSLIGELEKTS